MRLLIGLINTILNLYNILLLVYVILSWIRPAQNKWTDLLNRVVEPVLNPVRNFLMKNVPQLMRTFDFSPVAVWLLISLVRGFISSLLYF